MEIFQELDALRRQTSGVSRAEWLRRAGVNESTWYRWQAGANTPSLATVEALATALGAKICVKIACKCGSAR